jgi:hypothetical protein
LPLCAPEEEERFFLLAGFLAAEAVDFFAECLPLLECLEEAVAEDFEEALGRRESSELMGR